MALSRLLLLLMIPHTLHNLFVLGFSSFGLALRYQIYSLPPGGEIGHIVIPTNGAYVPILYQRHHLLEPFFRFHSRPEGVETRTVSLEKNVIANQQNILEDVECESRSVARNVERLYFTGREVPGKQVVKNEGFAYVME